MDQFKKKDQSRAIFVSIAFHGLLLLAFLYFGLSTPLPLPEEQGVLVALGFTEQGRGETQPLISSPPVPESRPSEPVSAPESVATQQSQPAVAMPSEQSPRERQRQEPESPRQDQTPIPEQTTTQAPPEEPRPQVDPRALFPGSDQRTTQRQDQGQNENQGNVGQPVGAIDGADDRGSGQGGVDYSLSGRRANSLPVPEYTAQAQGRVVVEILVDRQGRVIRATAGVQGSTTLDPQLLRISEEAARQARFDVQANAPEQQRGTITYRFMRIN